MTHEMRAHPYTRTDTNARVDTTVRIGLASRHENQPTAPARRAEFDEVLLAALSREVSPAGEIPVGTR